MQGLPVVIGRGQVAVKKDAFAALLARIPAVLAQGEGLPRDRLAAGVSGLLPQADEGWVRVGGQSGNSVMPDEAPSSQPSPGSGRRRTSVGGSRSEVVLDEALKRLVASGAVRVRGSVYSVPRPEQDQARASLEALLTAQIAQTLRQSRLSPPDVATRLHGRRVLERLVREGEVVRTHDLVQKRDVLFHREAIAEARRRLMPLLWQLPGLLVSEVGAALGISRKCSVPLLEHLDAIQFTRRIGDRRTFAPMSVPE